MPRMTIVHTSAQQAGQIYIPEINTALAVGTLLLVVTFRSATALGAAYGVAVTGTMAITSLLFYVITRQKFGWSQGKALGFLAFFLDDRPRLLPRRTCSRCRTAAGCRWRSRSACSS